MLNRKHDNGAGGLQGQITPESQRVVSIADYMQKRSARTSERGFRSPSIEETLREDIRQKVVAVATSQFPKGRTTGEIQFIKQLLRIWHLTEKDACVLMGFYETDLKHIQNILEGIVTLRGRDAKDRITNLFKIRRTLSSIFRDQNVENAWLREHQNVLEGQTPLQLLREGSMENLLRVRLLVEHMGGL